jgi:hypothetical protein
VRDEPPTEEHLRVPNDEDANAVLLWSRLDSVADADGAAREQVRAEAPAVNQRAKEPFAGHVVEMTARLAQLRSSAENVAQPKGRAGQVVEPYAARRHVPPRLPRLQPDAKVSGELLEHLGFDERQVAADARVLPMAGACGIAIPREADAGHRSGTLERPHALARRRGDVDVLDASHSASAYRSRRSAPRRRPPDDELRPRAPASPRSAGPPSQSAYFFDSETRARRRLTNAAAARRLRNRFSGRSTPLCRSRADPST